MTEVVALLIVSLSASAPSGVGGSFRKGGTERSFFIPHDQTH
jgi:hypothetical protein